MKRPARDQQPSTTTTAMGEFGIRPQRSMDTHNSNSSHNNRRFVAYLLDALNLESSQISAMNKDFSNSILPHSIEYSWTKTQEGGKTEITPKHAPTYLIDNRMNKQYDDSHFMIGIPLSQVGFQSGTVSSPNCNINFQFNAKTDSVPWESGICKNFRDGGVIAMFLTDCELCIQVAPGSDIPVVRLSSKSVV